MKGLRPTNQIPTEAFVSPSVSFERRYESFVCTSKAFERRYFTVCRLLPDVGSYAKKGTTPVKGAAPFINYECKM